MTLREVDTVSDDTDSYTIPCENEGYYYHTMRLSARNCMFSTEDVEYRVYFRVQAFDNSLHARIKYIYNLNRPSEFTYELANDYFSGDEYQL